MPAPDDRDDVPAPDSSGLGVAQGDAGRAGDGADRGERRWLHALLVVIAALAVVGFVVLPRNTAADPFAALGEEGSAARTVAESLGASMTCTAGELTDTRSVLACYQQTPDYVALVFLQADPEGRIASYTVETQPLASTPDTGQVIAVANQVAAIVTPGADFADCSYRYETPYFCFGSLATWTSPDIDPVESTGGKSRLPSVDEFGAHLNDLGWECDFGICLNGETMMTALESATGLGLQFSAPVDVAHVRQAAAELLREVGDADELSEWAAELDGTMDVIVADGLVIGFLPQLGDAGTLVIDEVAGVVPGSG